MREPRHQANVAQAIAIMRMRMEIEARNIDRRDRRRQRRNERAQGQPEDQPEAQVKEEEQNDMQPEAPQASQPPPQPPRLRLKRTTRPETSSSSLSAGAIFRLQTERDRLLASGAEKDRELEAFRRQRMETRRRNQMLRGLVGQT